jgi:hypothetical protein
MPHVRAGILVLFLLVIMLVLQAWRCRHAWHRALPHLPKRIRRLHPSTQDDCPHCRQTATPHQGLERPASTVRPWREGRSRGAPRRVPTDGYACRDPRCFYYAHTDAQIHALVADGHQGCTGCIQQFRCQACGAKVSARWGTALFHLKTPPARIGEVLSALAEGLDVGGAVRVFGHSETTITRWRDRAAQHAERVHRHFLHGLHLPHLQLDEIRARLRRCDRVTWLWLALDPRTKLISGSRPWATLAADRPHPCPRPARRLGRQLHAGDHH